MTKVSVLFNNGNSSFLGVSWETTIVYHLLSCLRKTNYRYIGISVPLRVFYRWCGLHNFLSLRRVFCVLNHKYIKWKCFLGILWLLSLISNYFCAFTAFVLLQCIFFQRFLKSQRGFFLCQCAVRITHYSLSINRVVFFLSINREKIRLFPSDFMRIYF